MWFVWSGKLSSEFSCISILSALHYWVFTLFHICWQEKNYSERVMLIYDGLHYDALAVCGFISFIYLHKFSGCQCGGIIKNGFVMVLNSNLPSWGIFLPTAQTRWSYSSLVFAHKQQRVKLFWYLCYINNVNVVIIRLYGKFW